ncbi:hypothetical protein ES319_A10G174800v1 [Gossypium barbadense]|uniref:Uncharacterized protein n=2 Tax=Gossypium TaxID=3633 RepID=A0A5J5U8A6_GOSBA|nr:hypothetical protein ES319_A10G174800v1 [Gossypium barbadense]KAB2062789.1 hypothetical protein ES319_A10G174800v1 [Gossypium barbadense]TYG99437.1 hypothetical protein ES288_A10G195200v1 [Gossypium darwinii]
MVPMFKYEMKVLLYWHLEQGELLQMYYSQELSGSSMLKINTKLTKWLRH